jgi:hypothetical protein
MKNKIALQANISGYDGKAVTLFAMYDKSTEILVVHSIAKEFMPNRFNDCLMIGNDERYPIDFYFNADMFRDSVSAYFSVKQSLSVDGKSNRLVFGDKALNADPINSIQQNGYDERGAKYAFDHLSNAHVATLACCFWASQVMAVDMAFDVAGELLGDDLITVGGEKAWYEQRVFVHGFQADPRYITEDMAKERLRVYGTDA